MGSAPGLTGARAVKCRVVMVTRKGQGHAIIRPQIMTENIAMDRMRKLTLVLFVDVNSLKLYVI